MVPGRQNPQILTSNAEHPTWNRTLRSGFGNLTPKIAKMIVQPDFCLTGSAGYVYIAYFDGVMIWKTNEIVKLRCMFLYSILTDLCVTSGFSGNDSGRFLAGV